MCQLAAELDSLSIQLISEGVSNKVSSGLKHKVDICFSISFLKQPTLWEKKFLSILCMSAVL